jgi:hypothetical protein
MLADAVDPQTSTAQKAAMVGLDAVGFLGGTVGITGAAGLTADLAEAQSAVGSAYTDTLLTDAMLGEYTSASEDEAVSLAQDAVLTSAKEMELVPKLVELSGHAIADFEVTGGMVSPQAIDVSLAALEANSQTSPKTLGLVQSLTGAATSVDAALHHAPGAHSVTTDPNQQWTASGVQISDGELVQVVATGKVWYNVNQPRTNWTWSTPAGWAWGSKEPFPANNNCPAYGSVSYGDILARALPCGSLLGKVGANGPVFELGAVKAFTAPVSGELYLGENSGSWGSESGGYTVTVSGDLVGGKQPVPGPNTSKFSPLINQIMRQLASLKLTTVPLQAPAGPLGPIGEPVLGGVLAPHMGAWFQADASSYEVTFADCSPVSPPPVHTVVASNCPDNGASSELAITSVNTYSAKRYHTVATAMAFLQGLLPREGGPATQVALGHGVVGQEYRPVASCFPRGAPCGKVVEWGSGRWHFVSNFSRCTLSFFNKDMSLPTARAMVALASSHPLPNAPGVVDFYNNCGTDGSVWATASWAEGSDVYSTSAFGSYSVPMLLAASMRPY